MSNIFLFIDGSYFCFYRYHSLITWWKHAYSNELDVLNNPYDNELFVNKFKHTFVDNIQKLQHKLGISLNINSNFTMLVGKDCKRENIWRHNFFSNYKTNRIENNTFMGGPFFKMVYEDDLFLKGGVNHILKHQYLEADDCIAITVKYLLQKYNQDCEIYIITSDKDYLQLAQNNVHLYNLKFDKLTEHKSSTKNSSCDLFCKILTGDVSDNIPSVFPKCGFKTALKYFNNNELFQQKLCEKEEYQQQFLLNQKLIDFNYIPQQYIHEFIELNNINQY